MKLLSLGEIIWDVYPDKKCIGGAPLNLAAHTALLSNESYLLSAVGGDELASPAIAELERFGVKTDFISTVSDKPTGACRVTLSGRGVPSYEVLRDVAYDYLTCPTEISGFDVFSFGTLIQRSEHNRSVIKEILKNHSFSHIFCDINLREPFYCEESALLCAQNATILKISREELKSATSMLLGRETGAPATAARALASAFANLKIIIITLDSDGAFIFDTENARSHYAAAKSTRVVSTVGAGDSFGAAFLSSFCADGDIEKALQSAIALSSFVVSRQEAVPIK